MKKLFFFFAVLLPSLLLSACSDSGNGRQLVIYGQMPIDGISTSDNYNFFGSSIDILLFSFPTMFSADYKSQSILLEEARPYFDWKVWKLQFKEGVRFHNGQLVTAHDVAASLKKTIAEGGIRSIIKEIETVNDRELLLRFDISVFNITDILEVPVYPVTLFNGNEHWRDVLLKNPIGSGPFRFNKWLKNGMELTANNDYFEGRPKLDRVSIYYELDEGKKLTYLLKGAADLLAPISPKTARFLEGDRRFYVNKMESPFFVAIFLNNNSPVFKDITVRKAVNLAVDREFLIEKGLNGGGSIAPGPFLKTMFPDSYKPEAYGYEPKRAAKLLNEAGWDGVKKRLRFKLQYISDVAEMKKVSDIIARQLFEVGVEVECVPVGINEFVNKQFISGEYDAILTIVNSFTYKELWQSRSVHESKSSNYSNYSNRDLDRLLDRTKKVQNEEKKKLFGEMDRIIHEDAPAVFLYNPVWFSAASRRFKGAEDFKGDPYSWYKIKDWSVEEDDEQAQADGY